MATKFKILILLLLTSIIACNNNSLKYKDLRGEKHFSAKKTCQIMIDLHKADAMVSMNKFTRNNKINDTIIYDIVFDKYNCSRQEFYETLLFHIQNNIDSINYYYEKNIEKLSQEQSNINVPENIN